jgi:hypothetical protein
LLIDWFTSPYVDLEDAIYWQFVAAIPIPVDELNVLLMDPDYGLDDYLSDNRELIDEYLVYRDSQTEDGISVKAVLAKPTTPLTYDPALASPVPLELFFVGPDRETALSSARSPAVTTPNRPLAPGIGSTPSASRSTPTPWSRPDPRDPHRPARPWPGPMGPGAPPPPRSSNAS